MVIEYYHIECLKIFYIYSFMLELLIINDRTSKVYSF